MKRILVFALLGVLLVAAFGSVQAQDDATLVLWHSKQQAEGDALLAILDYCMEANPGLVVEQVYTPDNTLRDSFQAAAGAGEGPDVIITANDNAGVFSNAGLIAPVVLSEETLANASDAAWGTFQVGGEQYGVPFSAKTLAFFYNRDLVPDAPATWADVLAISEELAQDGITGLAFQPGTFHSAGFLHALGGSWLTPEYNANFEAGTPGGDAMVAFLTWYQDLFNMAQDPASGVVFDGASPNPGFQTGTVAMVYDGIWNLAQFESDLGDSLGVSIMPALDNGNVPSMWAQADGFMLNAKDAGNAAKEEAFATFANCVTGVDAQTLAATEGGLLPVNPAVTLENPNLQVFAEQLALGTPFPNVAELGQFWAAIDNARSQVEGGADPAEVTAELQTTVQTGIDNLRAQ
ncbi:MAG: extracellular solute-binding protein [Anaerolineae bacterium]|nr:extracellular solute-binding protein [Anaerolineae bacterium]